MTTKTISKEAAAYVNAAARCLYMVKLYESAGTPKMRDRAAKARHKQCQHVQMACELTGMTPDEVHAMVVERYNATMA